MRLSTIFELLLILLLVAFAAYGGVIDRDEVIHREIRATNNVKQSMDLSTMSLKQATDSVNRYCTCNENICNCCRDFHIPVVQLKGPGCASLQYLQGDNLAVQLSFGDNILTSTIVNGKNPKPVCVPLPGGFTKFCGRVYSIQRDAKNHFKACLGLELQSATELEASLRVSCFRFGPDGLKLRPAEPLPIVEAEATEEEDDDDFFGLGSDDDEDEEDEENERPSLNSVPDASVVDDTQESDDDDEDDDLLGLGALLDIFTGEDDTTKRPKITTAAPLLEFTIPILSRPSTLSPLEDHEVSTFAESENNDEEHENFTQEPDKLEEEEEEEEEDTKLTESNIEENTDENHEQVTEASNKITYVAKPDKTTTNKVKKGVVGEKKKPTVTSTSVNAIYDPEKPAKKPIKDEDDEDEDDILDDDDDDDEDIDDEDDEILDDDDDKNDEDEDEDEEEDDKLDDEKYDDEEDDKAEDLAVLDDDDDDDEEDDAMLSALIGTGKSKKSTGAATNQTNVHKHDDEDYDFGMEFLARKRHSSGNRQSKITRL